MTQPAHIIREYKPADQAAAVKVWFNAGKREYTYLAGWREMTPEKATAIFCEVILRDCKLWVAASDTSQVAGFLALNQSYLDRLYVDPACQRGGCGSALMEKAKALSPAGLELHTHQQNHGARRFYERHGFRAVKFAISPAPELAPDVEYHWRPNT